MTNLTYDQTIPEDVALVLNAFPDPVRKRLLEVRGLIFQTAASIEGVGTITETLKWGEPAYLTLASKSGTTIRLGWKKTGDFDCAVLVNCHTTLVDSYRALFPSEFEYEGNRAILLKSSEELAEEALVVCVGMALSYHLPSGRFKPRM